jgi:hypothetical protein
MIVGWSTIDNLVYWRHTIEFCTTLCNLCSHYVTTSVPSQQEDLFYLPHFENISVGYVLALKTKSGTNLSMHDRGPKHSFNCGL